MHSDSPIELESGLKNTQSIHDRTKVTSKNEQICTTEDARNAISYTVVFNDCTFNTYTSATAPDAYDQIDIKKIDEGIILNCIIL